MQEQEIRTKLADLRVRYIKLVRLCNSWARINPQTIEHYIKQIKELETQLQQLKGGETR